MCAIARALMSRPRLVLLDEPSMGLAPLVVEHIFEIIRALNQNEKVSFLVAEQNTAMALRYAEHGYVLESGHVVLQDSAKALVENDEIKEFYLGLSKNGRRSFRVKRDNEARVHVSKI